MKVRETQRMGNCPVMCVSPGVYGPEISRKLIYG